MSEWKNITADGVTQRLAVPGGCEPLMPGEAALAQAAHDAQIEERAQELFEAARDGHSPNVREYIGKWEHLHGSTGDTWRRIARKSLEHEHAAAAAGYERGWTAGRQIAELRQVAPGGER